MTWAVVLQTLSLVAGTIGLLAGAMWGFLRIAQKQNREYFDARFGEQDATIAGRFAEQDMNTAKRFSELEALVATNFAETKFRFDAVDVKIDGIDKRLDGMDKRESEMRADLRELQADYRAIAKRLDALTVPMKPDPAAAD